MSSLKPFCIAWLANTSLESLFFSSTVILLTWNMFGLDKTFPVLKKTIKIKKYNFYDFIKT